MVSASDSSLIAALHLSRFAVFFYSTKRRQSRVLEEVFQGPCFLCEFCNNWRLSVLAEMGPGVVTPAPAALLDACFFFACFFAYGSFSFMHPDHIPCLFASCMPSLGLFFFLEAI